MCPSTTGSVRPVLELAVFTVLLSIIWKMGYAAVLARRNVEMFGAAWPSDRPAMTTLSMVVKDSPPLDIRLWTTTLVNQMSSAHERKSTECMEPRPRPLARPPLLPYLYVLRSASRYDLTAFSSPTNACTVRTLPITSSAISPALT
uniref:Uncharacterized protein n=1 Tax=Zea mays TaxID=4577 RepID=C4J4E3_MAIZE|nr:unknown [Zea mays]